MMIEMNKQSSDTETTSISSQTAARFWHATLHRDPGQSNGECLM
jgi:hypothetical protein